MSTEQLVFDTSLYRDLPPEIRKSSIQEDLAGLVIENGAFELEKRINPRKFEIIGNEIIDQKKGKNVLETLVYETRLDKKESKAAIAFYEHLLSHKNSLSISISPPGGEGNYFEGRVNVGFRNSNIIEFYGIPTLLSPDHLTQRAIIISSLSIEEQPISSPEELREISMSIILNEKDNPWEFLEEIFPLDSNTWEAIINGNPWIVKEKAEKDAKEPAAKGATIIVKAISAYQYIDIGAEMEYEMRLKGWEINGSSCPGKLNSQILSSTGVVIDSFRNTRITVSWEYHTGTCANCGSKDVPVGPCEICKFCEEIL